MINLQTFLCVENCLIVCLLHAIFGATTSCFFISNRIQEWSLIILLLLLAIPPHNIKCRNINRAITLQYLKLNKQKNPTNLEINHSKILRKIKLFISFDSDEFIDLLAWQEANQDWFIQFSNSRIILMENFDRNPLNYSRVSFL